MSSLRLAGITVVAATVLVQLVMTRLNGRRPSLGASVIFATYFALLAVVLRRWPIPTGIVLAACTLLMLWLARDAVLAGRDIEKAERDVDTTGARR